MYSLYHLYSQLSVPVLNLHVERKSTNYLHAAAISLHGWRSSQEDEHSIELKLNDNGLMLFGVYDGHGGPRCAQFLAQRLPRELAKIKDIRYEHEIADIYMALDKQFLKEEQCDDGSTACVVLGQFWDADKSGPLPCLPADYTKDAYPQIVIKLLAINVGDSRAMIINEDCTEYWPLTKDHKPDDPIEHARIIAAGGYVSGSRVDGTLALSRSFGDKHYKCNELIPYKEQKVNAVPEINTFFLQPGSMLILTCDGIFESELMSYTRVTAVVRASKKHYTRKGNGKSENFTDSTIITNFDPAGICRDLISKSLEYGSHDNHTALVVHFLPTPQQSIHPDGYEFIPGPCNAFAPDITFLRCYRNDIAPYIEFSQVVDKIALADLDFMSYCEYRDKLTLDHAMLVNTLGSEYTNSGNNNNNNNNKTEMDNNNRNILPTSGNNTRYNTMLNNTAQTDKQHPKVLNSDNYPGFYIDISRPLTHTPPNDKVINLYTQHLYSQDEIPLYYQNLYLPRYPKTGTTLVPLYFPEGRAQYSEILSAMVQGCVTRYDDHDDLC